MKIQFETDKILQSKDQEKKVESLIKRFKLDLEMIGFKVISFDIPTYQEEKNAKRR